MVDAIAFQQAKRLQPLLHLRQRDGSIVPDIRPHIMGAPLRRQGTVGMTEQMEGSIMSLVPDPMPVMAQDDKVLPVPDLRIRLRRNLLRQALHR